MISLLPQARQAWKLTREAVRDEKRLELESIENLNRAEEANETPSMTDQFFDGNRAIAEAQKCRQMLLDQTGAKSIWCIVTRKGFWPACYFFPRDEDMLREKLNRGHEVLLVFAIGRRHALASCTGYQPIQLEAADKTFRRFARRAMRQMA